MTRDELQASVERYTATFHRHDPAALAAFHAPDGIVESPMYATLKGRAAIEDAYRAFFTSFPDAATTNDVTIVDGSTVANFVTISGTHVNEFYGMPGTNRRMAFRMARLLEMDRGLIARERRVYDFTGVLVQVGVLKAKPTRPIDD